MFIIFLFQPSCQKSCHHGVACAYRVDKGSFRCRKHVHLSVCIQKHCSLSAHGYEHIQRSLFLHFPCIRYNRFLRIKFHSENRSQLMLIRLDQKWMIRKYFHQQVIGRIHHCEHSFSIQPLHNLRINRFRNTCRNASCQHQNISFFQSVQLFQKCFHSRFTDSRSLSIDLGSVKILHFDIDS